MKKILLLLAAIALSIFIYFTFFKKRKVKSILFIGDSNTAANYSYADKIKSYNPKLITKKIALVGAKTSWMLEQLKSELNMNDYDMVCVLGGSNDIYALSEIDSTKQNLNSMYSLIKSTGAKVYAITPPNKDYYENKTEQKQTLLHDLVGWIKQNNKKDYLSDFYTMTANIKYFSATDGYLHANSEAHDILAKKVINDLDL